MKYGVHIDLYKFFFNRSVQIYAYGGRYRDISLNDVAKALLGMEKIPIDKEFGDLSTITNLLHIVCAIQK